MTSATSIWRFLGGARPALVAALAAGAIFSASLVPAMASPSAADPTPTATATPRAKLARPALNNNQHLKKQLQQEEKRLTQEQKRLARADTVVVNTQKRIDNLKAKNQDASQLTTALAGYKTALATARAGYATASKTLDAKAGFDANGQVAEAAQARTTLETARQAMAEARQTMNEATRELKAGKRTFTLSERLTLEQKRLAAQQKRLDQAGKVVTRTQHFIATQKGKGEDTSKVETALGDFQTAITSAQASYDSARTTLEAKAGFDANGQVTDAAQARTTLETARQAMAEARQTMNEAGRELRQAIRQFRQDNKA